jgi:RNA polymerase sigma factor (sigma-70 family)
VAKDRLGNVVDCLRRTACAGDRSNLTDGQLLEAYIKRREEAAVAALVRRHGPMVWGVCRRVLHNHHDAEDAFQATFLVLVRKAASIVPRERVGGWLHGVAHQTALKARATAGKRQARERQVEAMPEPEVPPERDLWTQVEPILDQELGRLPDRYRVAVVLCDLEGNTRKEAARRLGIPEGTLSTRLRTARTLLARRLARHGLSLSAGALAAVLSRQAASACVPPSVASSTIKAASLLAAGAATAGAISVKVAALTEGVMKAMLLAKLKTAAVGLLLLALLGSAAGTIYRTQAAEQPKTASERTEKQKPDRAMREQDEAATPVGRILRIDPRGKVYINLGKENQVRPQLTFTVYGAGSYRDGRHPKATLEVVAVLGPHLSRARVTWLRDPDRDPVIKGDELYSGAWDRTLRDGEDTSAKKEQNQPPHAKLYNGDRDVEELIHKYRGLSEGDKLGREGERVRQWLVLLSRSDEVALSPFARDALAGILAEHQLRGELREAKKKHARDAGKGGGEEPGAETRQEGNEPERVEGLVKKVDTTGRLVTLTIGSDAGLSRGHTLEVFRISTIPAQSKYLGRLRVIEVSAREAVAEPVDRLTVPVRVGDRVADRIEGGH